MPAIVCRLALCVALLALSAPAQRYSFRYYGQDDGLSNLSIECLFQDRAGFLWVGSQNGLFRYDGARFVRFGMAEGLTGSTIIALAETQDGVIWASTFDGLARSARGRFERVSLPLNAEPSGRGSLAVDPSNDTLYVSTTRGIGVLRAGSGNRRADFLPGTAGRRTWSVAVENPRVLWFGCDGQVCRSENGVIQRYGTERGVPADHWESILIDHQHNVWIRSTRNLLVKSAASNRFGTPSPAPFTNAGIAVLALDHRGWVYSPTDFGLQYWTGREWRRVTTRQGLLSDSVQAFVEDREGSMWIGAGGAGLERWRGPQHIESWTTAEGLSNEYVWAIDKDRAGDIWMGTNLGVSRIRAADRQVITYTHGLANQRIRSITSDRQGDIWIGSSPLGITRLNPKTGETTIYDGSSGLPDARVVALAWSPDARTLWAGTVQGLYRAERSSRMTFRRERLPGESPDEEVYSIQFANGRMWLATSHGVLIRTRDTWSRVSTADGLRADRLRGLVLTKDAAWVLYRRAAGVSRIAFDGLRITHFGTANGLGSDGAVFIGADYGHRLWVGTDNGVDMWDGSTWDHLGRADGLIWDDCNTGAFLADPDGSVWFGTSRGVSHLRLGPDSIAPVRPPAVITAVTANGKPQQLAAVTATIPYSDASIEFSFGALTYLNERSTRFRYRLVGLESDWVQTDRPEVRYPKLAPGKYRIEVIARSGRGIESAAPAVFEFSVIPPWWMTWWFKAICVALVLMTARAYWIHRLYRLTEQRRQLEDMVEGRTEELRTEKAKTEAASRYKSEFLANMSHEIRTPMNGVLGMIHLALGTELTDEQREYLDMSRSSAESLLSILNDVLDLAKIESGKMELAADAFDVGEQLRDVVRNFESAAGAKGVALKLTLAAPSPVIVVGDATRFRQVIVNLVGNAVKFTDSGEIVVSAAIEDRFDDSVRMLFYVSDTGIGIPPEKCDQIFDAFCQADGSITRRFGGTGLGLAISSKIVNMMGGRIWVAAQQGRGSIFYFTAQFATVGNDRETQQRVLEPHSDQVPAFSARVLLAEDNRINQVLATRLLEKAGCEVVLAESGEEAWRKYQGQQFDVVLMDVQMPVMDGFAATARIREIERETGRYTPIIAMTAHAMKGDQERCLAAGMDSYLTKPIQAAKLYAAVAATVRQSA